MSFRIALSGLNAAQASLDVTANNIANANTTGFKESRAEFTDVYATAFGSIGSLDTGAGVRLAAVSPLFTQGNIDFTGNALDLAVNGEFTLGENIGDLGGISIGLLAYKMSLNGAEPPVIDGFTGIQRVFLGYSQVWRSKTRDEALRVRIATDPHSPPRYRANGAVRNVPEFYEAFNVEEGDALYLPPEERVKIW